MSRRSHRSHKHKHSSSFSQQPQPQPQEDEIPIDPNLIDHSSFAAYNQAQQGYTQTQQGYTQTDPNAFAQWQSDQPATVNPNDLWLYQGGSSSSAAQGYAGPAYQDADNDEPAEASSSSAAAQQQDYQCQDCGRICHGLREFNKHAKTHKKPIRCEADKSCKEKKAEQRDMNRHYMIAHKEFAADKGLLTDPRVCDYPECGKMFTRPDNLLKHFKKYHGGK
ncbi:hypothetical protein ACHAPT_000370 [Fusarium lateritium]